MRNFDHTFVVPAYKYSGHLAECLGSLQSQNEPSAIRVSTSTPDERTEALCRRYGVDYIVHERNGGIAEDWNHALRCAGSKWVTLAHQDDVYYADFSKKVGEAVERGKGSDAILAFTNYDEMVEEGVIRPSRLIRIKRMLLELGFIGRSCIGGTFSKRNTLRFGCPIPCPSVTVNTVRFHEYDASFQVNLDWASWLAAADADGAFLWVRTRLMAHRIHESSETSTALSEGRRQAEDWKILSRMWPRWIAWGIAKSYRIAYASNKG